MAAEDVTAEIHGFSEADSTPTPWAAGLEQLRSADSYWLSTVRPDGRPHVTPLIAVWHAEALWFATGPEERKSKNLAGNPSYVLTTGRSDLVEGALDLMIEGRAEMVTNDAELEPVAIAFADKYPTGPWDFVVRNGAFGDRDAGEPVIVFRVRPARGLDSERAITSARQPGRASDKRGRRSERQRRRLAQGLQLPHRRHEQLLKRVTRVAVGFASFENFRSRALLYAAKTQPQSARLDRDDVGIHGTWLTPQKPLEPPKTRRRRRRSLDDLLASTKSY